LGNRRQGRDLACSVLHTEGTTDAAGGPMWYGHYIIALALLLISASSYAGADSQGLRFNAALSGAQIVPAVETRAGAIARVEFDPAFTQVRVSFRTTGDLHVTSAQLHCAPPGEVGPAVLQLLNPGPLFELRDRTAATLDHRHIAAATCAAASGIDVRGRRSVNNIAALAFAMRDGLIYVSVDSLRFPQGELRGQFLPVAETGELELPDDRLVAPFPR
ncbi:MAG: CHRD domain-containing protein, partial [Pseudomonadales bacterium]